MEENRIEDEKFEQLKEDVKKALVLYIQLLG